MANATLPEAEQPKIDARTPGEGPHIRLRLFAGEAPGQDDDDLGWARAALDALDALRPVVQPLAAELTLGCRDLDLNFLDDAARPPQPQWFLRQDPLPPSVVAEPTYVHQREDAAPELTRAVFDRWMQAALRQPCPDTRTHATCWTRIGYAASCARLFDEAPFAGRDTLRLLTELGGLALAPLERRPDGLWASGPVGNWSSKMPIAVSVSNGDGEGSLDLDVDVPWTLWYESGTPGRAALSAALRRVVAQGWWVDENAGPRGGDLLDG